MTPPREPPRPDRRIIAGDEQPSRDTVHHPAVDGAPQAPPRRTGTLPSMAALQAPPLPAEHKETKRAPSPWSKTIIQPPPPSSVARARRSDPPTTHESPAPLDAPAGQPDALAALQRQLAEAQAQIDRLQQPAFPPPVSERPQVPPAPPVPSSIPPKGWNDPRLIKAVTALVTAMAGLGVPATVWLTAKSAAAERTAERTAAVTKDAAQTATSAKAQSRDVAKELDELKKQLADERAYNREVLRRMGIQVPKRPGDPDPPTLDVTAPLRRPGTVSPGVVLEVRTPPP